MRNPVAKEKIKKMTGKWATRTKKTQMQYPKDGSFEVSLCEETNILIKNPNKKVKGSE